MRTICSVLHGVPAKNDAPVIASMSPVFPGIVEPLAYESWILAGGPEALTGISQNLVLTPSAAQPIFGTASMTIPEGRNGLHTGLYERDVRSWGFVYKNVNPMSNGRHFIGNDRGTSIPIAERDGVIAFQSVTDSPITINQRRSSAGTLFSGVSGLSDQYLFIGFSIDPVESGYAAYIHGVGMNTASRAGDTFVQSETRQLTLGNVHYAPQAQNAPYDAATEYCELHAFKIIPTLEQWRLIAQRAVNRCALKGIEVYS